MSWAAAELVGLGAAHDGLGAFALRDIPRGTVIGIFAGVPQRFALRDGAADYGVADSHLMLDLHVDGEHLYALTLPDSDCPINRINHSCRPNCELTGVHGLTLIARRDIACGEELFFDYRPVTLVPVGVACWCGGGCRL